MNEINTLASNNDVLKRKSHTLLCYILAMYDFNMLKNPLDEHWCPVIEIQESEHDQLHDALVSFSAIMRVNDDLLKSFEKHKKGNPSGVGNITYGNDTTKPLTLREACNKIIHCRKYEWNLAYSNEHPIYPEYDNEMYNIEDWQKYKNPILNVQGKFHDKAWSAEIFILKYILAYGWSTEHY
jgi:hypothetical protein